MEPWRVGSCFLGEREKKRKGESAVFHYRPRKMPSLPKVAGEKERGRVKTFAGDWTRNLFSKTIDREKGEGFNTIRTL